MPKLAKAFVFLTGATGGIGQHFIAELLRHPVERIYAADLNATSWRNFPNDRRVIPLNVDITDPGAVSAAASLASGTSILINNAGVNLRAPFLASLDLVAARQEMDVNYFGTLSVIRAFAPILRRNSAAGGETAIVNVMSILAKVTLPNVGSYCASKAALLRLTEGVRAELAPDNVRVIAVMPWAVDTSMSASFKGDKTSPQDVAAGVLDAIECDQEDVYFHSFTAEINAALRSDPKSIEHKLNAAFRGAP